MAIASGLLKQGLAARNAAAHSFPVHADGQPERFCFNHIGGALHSGTAKVCSSGISSRTQRWTAPPSRRGILAYNLVMAKAASVQKTATNAFVNQPEPPTDAELATALGASKPLWEQLLAVLATECSVPIREWHSYSRQAGWSLRVK